jgi:Uri superfamily endonuclease
MKGTYALLLRLGEPKEIIVGRRGRFPFPAGYYLYVGSALGPGGLEARLARHIRAKKRLHWHIDYLLEHAQVVEVWTASSDERLECQWAEIARGLPGATVPVPYFGSSDCRCPAHLVHFTTRPSLALFAERIRRYGLGLFLGSSRDPRLLPDRSDGADQPSPDQGGRPEGHREPKGKTQEGGIPIAPDTEAHEPGFG